MKAILTTLLLTITSVVHSAEIALPLDYEERIIVMTILGEARGEGKAGMYAVACVIRKRMIERKMDAVDVCIQNRQFSCWNGNKAQGKLFKLLNSSKEHTYAMKLAPAVVQGGLDLNYVKHANHYCTLKTHNAWTRGNKPVKIIGNHKFFKLD